MTKKDYELIAGLFRGYYPRFIRGGPQIEHLFENLVEDFSLSLEKDNPRFSRETFYNACGLDYSE